MELQLFEKYILFFGFFFIIYFFSFRFLPRVTLECGLGQIAEHCYIYFIFSRGFQIVRSL